MEPPADRPAWIPEHALSEVADRRAPTARPRRVGTTRVVLDDELNPFERLSPDGRKRLLVRVLCGLVAYDTEAEAETAATDLLAG